MSLAAGLTRELYGEPGVTPAESKAFLDSYSDTAATHEVARFYGNENPRPPRRFFYDKNLKGTGTLAWYLDPQEVKEMDPLHGSLIEQQLGSEPLMAVSPDVIQYKKRGKHGFVNSVRDHEMGHGGQQGKNVLARIGARTRYGDIQLGLMLVEGGLEYALERRGKTPPSRYMDNMSGGKSLYGLYRDFVIELEQESPGLTRQIYRAAKRGGVNAAIRMMQEIPEKLVEKYAKVLNAKFDSRYIN